MDTLLQVWGGIFYLLNKVFFAIAEGKSPERKRQFKILGWLVYIIGVPAWVIVLTIKHHYIIAAIEAGGVPSMFLGLSTVYYANKPVNRYLDKFATFSIYIFIIIGISFSIYTYGGLTALTQILEIGTLVGFLIGSYFLAKNNPYGWLFFMLMNSSVAILMYTQDKILLCIQQLLSLSFVIYGFIIALKTSKPARIP